MRTIVLSERQEKIAEMVRADGPISGHAIAKRLSVTRAALRSDLAILTMLGILDARPKMGYFYIGNESDNLLADEIRSMTVSQCLSQPVMVPQEASAYDAIVTMFTEDVGTLFVGTQQELAGVISRKDLLKAAMGKRELTTLPVRLVMTSSSRLIYVEMNDDVLSAAQKMIDYEVDCLPVVDVTDKAGEKIYRVRGRISKTGMTRLLVDIGRGKGRGVKK